MEWKKYGVIAIVAVLAIALVFALIANSNKLSEEDANTLVVEAEAVLQKDITSLEKSVSELETEKSELETDITELDTKVAELEEKIVELTPVEAEPVEPEAPSFLIRDVDLKGDFEGTVDNDDLESLFYGELEYDGETYDVEEVLSFNADFKPVLNVEDFGSDVAIEVGEESFSYSLIFDDPILLVEDEDLVISFLGKELSIVSSDDDKITYRTSEKVSLALGEEYIYQNYPIKVVGFDDEGDNQVLLLVNGELVSLEEGESKRISNLKVSVKDIFLSSIGDYNSVVLYVGKDIVETVSDKEEFEDDDRYDWIVKSDASGISEIGVKLIEELTEEDEVLALGDSISLPYDYKTVTFDSLKELDVVDLTASVRTDEIKVSFDGKIEIKGKRIDDSVFKFTDADVVEYEYKGDEYTALASDVVIFVGDRELAFEASVASDNFKIGNYKFGYEFGVKEIVSGPANMNEDDDYRKANGDILYASDANNDDDEETSVKLGLVNDEDKEVVLKVV